MKKYLSMSDIIFFLYVTKLFNLLNPHTLKDKTFNNISNNYVWVVLFFTYLVTFEVKNLNNVFLI